MNRKCGNAFTLIELLVSLFIIAVLAGLLLPVIIKAKRNTRNTACKAKLYQLGVATALYAEENEGKLPWFAYSQLNTNAEFKVSSLLRIDTNTLICPQLLAANPMNFSLSIYQWNEELNGKLLHKAQGQYALFLDCSNWHGHRNAVFTDGHTGIVSK
jgi:prepilin-type N-terminal cleavage/methylation domain-containing protein